MNQSVIFCFLIVLDFIVSATAFECLSYGVDYVDGGGPYCVNTASSDPFSFISYFEGMPRPVSQANIPSSNVQQAVIRAKAASHQY